MPYSLKIAKDSPQHAKIVAKIESRVRLAEQAWQNRHEKWLQAEETTLAFLPETEKDARRRTERTAGVPRYTTIQIPYTYGLLMSAHTYWTSVFFARTPVHQYSGRHGEGEMQVQAMEALIGYQVDVGSFLGPYYIWLYDSGKYGCGVLGHYWCQEKLHYGALVEMTDPNTGQVALYQTTQELEGYRGNRVYNVSVWDFMTDPRVPLKEFQRGEFCCARKRLGWHEILQRKDAGYYNENVKFLNGHLTDKGRSLGSSQLVRPQFDRMLQSDEGVENQHPAGASLWEFYVDLIPREWGVGDTNYPQKWCFTITEDLELLIGASPLGLMHCKFPFDVMESEVEGYGMYTRGMPEIMEGVQTTVDWLINTHFFNVRAALNNQFIVDPSKLVVKDVQQGTAGFVWRLRPEAYGTDITKMFMQVPVSDVTRAHITDFQTMLGIGERTIGINDQIMGSLGGTSRKTATEVRTTTGFGVNRLKTVSEYMSATAFSPHSQKLVQTSQQMYDASAKLRRVGSFAQDAGQEFLQVGPDDIVGFFDFVPVDGILPIDRMAQANLWKEIMANVRNMPPQVAMGYDWARVFGWAAQLAGLKNINQFKIQLVPDAILQQSAQAGNVVPLGGPPRASAGAARAGGALRGVQQGNAASTAAGLNALV